MPRGRRPLVALEEAEAIGANRGRVVLLPGKRGDSFDLLLYLDRVTVHVRVKRSITGISDPWEILATYRREIIRLCKIPLTAVVAREFWVRSSHGKWRFFWILADRIVEIHKDGLVIKGADFSFSVLEAPVRVAKPAVSAGPVVPKSSSDSVGERVPAGNDPEIPARPEE